MGATESEFFNQFEIGGLRFEIKTANPKSQIPKPKTKRAEPRK